MFPYSLGAIKRTGNSVRSRHEVRSIYTVEMLSVFYVDIIYEMFCDQRNSYVFENKYRQDCFPDMKGFPYNLSLCANLISFSSFRKFPAIRNFRGEKLP
jgi:hypothetical protein